MAASRKAISDLLLIGVSMLVGALAGFALYTKIYPGRGAAEFPSQTISVAVSPDSINNVIESSFDSSQDGSDDAWTVLISPEGELSAQYGRNDRDSDGTMEESYVMFPELGAMLVALREPHGLLLSVRLTNSETPDQQYKYEDIELDGRFDQLFVYRDGNIDSFFIRIDSSWVRAGRDAGIRPGVFDAWRTKGHEKEHLEFTGGEWSPRSDGLAPSP